ncbi:hypothetical protein J5N97_011877 [Dioscorea zingiberensis]|uniref:S-locus glycoprotein domain-containing protein n=1 Tax=Dioscorea zingiberensis TaxID=325984 RepID=A0A9D5D3I5_9LILI|nr:hypothetical protein J5N97_011877 [Dioscorea zingiberensis]
MGIHANGDPQVILQTTKSWLWRGGNWDGVRFTGIPEMKTYSAFNFTFVDNEEEMYYMYHILDDSIISRLVVNYDGTTQRLVWLNESSMWNVFWFAPKDPCDKAWSLWKEENCMELVDESIGQEFPMAEVFRVYKSGAVVCTRKTRRQANNVICGSNVGK